MNLKRANTIFQTLAGIASIVGLVAVFVSQDRIKGWIALCVVIAFLVYLAALLALTFNRLVKQKYANGYIGLATHSRYTCIDGRTVEYQTEKIIQSKTACLFIYEHGFYWSGTRDPTITCDPHEIVSITHSGIKSKFSEILIRLREALLYNQVEVISITMKMDDSDHKSEPHVGQKLDFPTQVISWRVELGGHHDRSHAPGHLTRCRITSETSSEWEFIRDVPYHPIHCCYEDRLLHPEPGYFYRLSWKRI